MCRGFDIHSMQYVHCHVEYKVFSMTLQSVRHCFQSTAFAIQNIARCLSHRESLLHVVNVHRLTTSLLATVLIFVCCVSLGRVWPLSVKPTVDQGVCCRCPPSRLPIRACVAAVRQADRRSLRVLRPTADQGVCCRRPPISPAKFFVIFFIRILLYMYVEVNLIYVSSYFSCTCDGLFGVFGEALITE